MRTHWVAATLCVVLGMAGIAQQAPENRDAGAVVQKVRDAYRSLRDYHFVRTVVVEESARGAPTAILAELALTTASENGELASEGNRILPINSSRLRLGMKRSKDEQVQVCGDAKCWAYTSLTNEYMTGATARDVTTSVGWAMLLSFHLFTFSMLEEGVIQNATIARREAVMVGGVRRNCLVIDGEIVPSPMLGPGGSSRPPSPASLGAAWFVTGLTLGDGRGMLRYSPWQDEQARGKGQPTRVTLWVDENVYVLVKASMASQLYKSAMSKEPRPPEPVAVSITDTFTKVGVAAPPAEVFHFTPPPGAKEVPNVTSRRQKRQQQG